MEVGSNPRSVEAKITRLTREIAEIDEFFYRGEENQDRYLYASMLERKRDDVVRSAVLQIHTAIENVLNSQITCRILNAKLETRSSKMRTKSGQALRKMLFRGGSMGFEMKLRDRHEISVSSYGAIRTNCIVPFSVERVGPNIYLCDLLF